jgi:hypothetical protein
LGGNVRVKLLTRESENLLYSFSRSAGPSVKTGTDHGIVSLHYCQDCSSYRDIFALEPIWVSCAVPPFMMTADSFYDAVV